MGKATVPSLQLVSSLVLAPFAICWVLRAYTADQEGATREPHEPSRNGTRKIVVYGPLPLSRRFCATAYQPPNFHFRSGVMPTCATAMRGEEQMPAQPSPWPIHHPCPRPRLREEEEEAAERRLARVTSFLSP